MIGSIIYFSTVENTQNELPLGGGVEQPSQRTPGGGGSKPPNGGSSKMHDWGGVHKITGVHGPPQGGGCRKHPV